MNFTALMVVILGISILVFDAEASTTTTTTTPESPTTVQTSTSEVSPTTVQTSTSEVSPTTVQTSTSEVSPTTTIATSPSTITHDCVIPQIPNGKIHDGNNTTFNSTAIVTCSPGYTLNGTENITCQANRSWSELPTCDIIDCGMPNISHNHFLDGKDTRFNSIVTVKCSQGYTLNGTENITCQANGSWTELPTCDIIDCGIPEIPNGKIHDGKHTTFNSTATVTCSPGYTLNGTENINCQANRSWSELPTCDFTDCGSLDNITNGKLDGPNVTTVGGVATLTCNVGYQITGDKMISCMSNGSWSPSPTCEIKDCESLDNITNGKLDGPNVTTVGGVATFTCNVGYQITGDKTITCMSNGSWSPSPTCVIKDCESLDNITNGKLDGPNVTTVGGVATLTCNVGYLITGNETISCSSNGSWSPSPTCELKNNTLDESCIDVSGSCQVDNSSCIDGFCKCDGGFYPQGPSCVEPVFVDIEVFQFELGYFVKATNSSFEVSWITLNDADAFDHFHFVLYDLDSDVQTNKTDVIRDRRVNKHTFNGLQAGTNYSVTVYVTKRGIINSKNTTLYQQTRPNNIKEANLFEVTTHSFQLQWTDIPAERFQKYKVLVKPQSDQETVSFYCEPMGETTTMCEFSRDTNITNITISNIDAGLEYNVSLFTIAGNQSSPGMYLKSYTRPLPPSTLYFTDVHSENFTIHFNDTTLNFDNWTIEYGLYNSNATPATETKPRDENSIVVTEDIQSGSKYVVMIWSSVSIFTSPIMKKNVTTRPSSPLSISTPIRAVTATGFLVVFESVDNRFDKWRILVCEDKLPSECKNETVPYNMTSVSITNRKAATFYNIQLFTALESGLECETPMSTVVNTAPLQVTAQLEQVEFSYVVLKFEGNDNASFQSYLINVIETKEKNQNTSVVGREQSDVQINGLTEGTHYTFEIFAVLNNTLSQLPTTITTYTRPGSVTNIHVSGRTLTSLTVAWNRPSNGEVNQYNATFFCVCQDEHFSTINKTNSTVSESATIEGLSPGTECEVYVTTAVQDQIGDPVNVQLNMTTKEDRPSKPEGFSISDITSKSVILKWRWPGQRNGIVRQYVAWYININDTTDCKRANLTCLNCPPLVDQTFNDSIEATNCEIMHTDTYDIAQTDFSWNISGLHPFRHYKAYTTALTVSVGENSTSDFETNEDIPGMPVNIVNTTTSSTINLTWEAPTEQNGIVTNYSINYAYRERICRGEGNLTTDKQSVLMEPLTKYTLNNLFAFWNYSITIQATNNVGTGQSSDVVHTLTDETNPEEVEALIHDNITSESVLISWDEPCFSNGVLTGFTIKVLKEDIAGRDDTAYVKEYQLTANNRSYEVNKLQPYRNYTLSISAKNNAGNGTVSTFPFKTKIGRPSQPAGVGVVMNSSSSSSLLVSWDKTNTFTGPTQFVVQATDVENSSVTIQCKTDTAAWTNDFASKCNVTGLDAYWEYEVKVNAVTYDDDETSLTNTSEPAIYRTAESVPGPVTDVKINPQTDVLKPRSFYVQWKKPVARDLNGILTGFVIKYNFNKSQNVGAEHANSSIFDDVIGNYSVTIQAKTSVGAGTIVAKNIVVNPGAPIKVDESDAPLMQKASVSVDNDEKQIAVALPLAQFLCKSNNGPPTMWGIVVAEADEAATDTAFAGTRNDFQKKIHDTYKNWFQVDGLNNIPPYIVTKPDWKAPCTSGNRRKRFATDGSKTFIVGNEECHGSSTSKEYCNGPLPDGRSFKVKSFVCTDYGCSETIYSQPIETVKIPVEEPNMTAAIVGGAVSAIVVLVLVVLLIFFMRRRQAACFKKDTESITHTSSDQFGEMGKMQTKEKPVAVYKPGPVKLTEIPAFVEKMHKDSDLLFADAYKAIKEKSPKHPCTVAESQNCRAKNRYTNILSFDHSRVKLRPSDDVDGSDFINANYIPGYTSPREYIATQGPMLATFDDFWRMVWEQNVDTIVMLTKLVEKGRIKCDKYWPDVNEPVYYGDLVVSVTSESNLSDYTLRIFEIKLKEERRSVRQFAYLKWPDMGCPEDPEMLLEFVKAVKEHNKRPGGARNAGPMIVHCSAGVGRTGTFIVVDHVLQHIRDHDDVDIYKLVLDMRNHRCNMVQTEDQFIYIHECLKAFITTDEDDEEEEPEDEHLYENTRYGEENVYENTAYQNDAL